MNAPSGDDRSTPEYEYNEYPKTLAPDDFWGQVRRTRYGRPISDEDLEVVVETIRRGLDLRRGDALVDLACGNGALSSRLFGWCGSFLGVDASEYLIGVAKENFERLPDHRFTVADVGSFVWDEPEPERFNKAMCYASFAYLSKETAAQMLTGLSERFVNTDLCFIGNVPDRSRADLFYPLGSDYVDQLSNHASQIGIWWSEEEFTEFAAANGWHAQCARMPGGVFNAIYRYDAILTRRT